MSATNTHSCVLHESLQQSTVDPHVWLCVGIRTTGPSFNDAQQEITLKRRTVASCTYTCLAGAHRLHALTTLASNTKAGS